MATTIKLKNSVTTTSVPSSLVQGEVAINITDKKVWVGNAATTPIQLLGGGADGNFTNISVSSVATFGAGTVSAPSITTTGDTNTGIFFPAADTIAFSEGGVESMRIDSSGNVGIGTSSPARTIDIARSSSSGNSANFPALLVKNTLATQGDGSTTFNYARIDVQAGNGTVFADFGTRYDSYAGAFLGTETNHPIYFQTNGTERMRIDSSGNVGIGVSSPARKLHISGGASVTYLQLSNDASGNTNADGFQIAQDGANVNIINREAGYITLDTSNTERMRITSGGDMLVNTTSSTGHKMTVQAASSAGAIDCVGTSTNGYYALRVDMPSTNTYGVLFRNNGNNVGDIRVNSSSTAYNTSSDYRLKENILPMTGALNKVAQLKPVTYDWKAGGSSQGFIAHELQAVVPDAVTGEKDAVNEDGSIKPQGIDTSFLVATLTAAIQEQQQIINDLKARIETLESK